MKKYSLIILLFAVSGAFAQSRQNIANFSQFNQYFNPALTGAQGSNIKSFYRDQYTSFEDAPKTTFLSGEYNVGENSEKLQHGIGLAFLHDTYGAQTDNRLNLSYAAGVKISEKIRLKAGVAATYNNSKFDNSRLSVNETGDPAYQAFIAGNNVINKYGANLGVAVTSEDFYAGYSISDLVKGGDSDNAYFNDIYVVQHTLQAGFRRPVTTNLGLVLNAIYRYDENLKGMGEAQLKSVFMNTFWIGAGYRNDVAYTFNTGLRYKQFILNYSRELSSNKVSSIYRGGNEITLSYNISPPFKSGKALNIW